MGTRTAITTVLALCALALGAVASPATADTAAVAAVAFSDGPRHEVETTLTVSGTSDAARRVTATLPPDDGTCDTVWYEHDVLVDGVAIPAGEFTVTAPVTFASIGRKTLCVMVHRTDSVWWDGTAVLTRRAQPFEVANARATIAISSRLDGRRQIVTISGETERRRFLEARWWRGSACGEYGAGTDLRASLIPIGPGPFSETFELDTYGRAAEERAVCAAVESPVGAWGPDDRLIPDARAEQLLRWPAVEDPPSVLPPPRAVPSDDVIATAPQDGASGVALNPTFSWQGSLRTRPFPTAADTLVIRRVRGERVTPLLRLDGRSFRLLDDGAGMEMYDSGATDTIADHVVHIGALVTVRLKRGLPPGVYEWTVERRGRAPSPPRRLTVVAPRLTALRATSRRKANGRSWDPGWTFLTLRSASYVRYEFAYRHGGGRWTAYRIPARRTTQQAAVIGWSCKRPGGVFRWRVTAVDGWGGERSASGSTPNVTRADCDRMRRREAAERRAAERRRAAEERRRRAREERRRRAEERRRAAERDRFERNCAAVGGTAVWIDEGGGRQRLICRAPFGGELPVPGFDY